VLGALGPFLQVSNLSMFLLLASSGKIFLQNFLIGIFVGFILGCPSQLEESGTTMVDYVRPKLRKGLSNTAEFFTKPFQPSEDKQPEPTKNPQEDPKESSPQTPPEAPKESPKPEDNSEQNPQEVLENSQEPVQEQTAASTDSGDNASKEPVQTNQS
jgi:hypothetical protein